MVLDHVKSAESSCLYTESREIYNLGNLSALWDEYYNQIVAEQ